MEFLNVILPVLLYIFGIILLIVLIILGIRMIEHKVNSLDGFFTILDRATDGFALITEHVAQVVTSTISRVFKKKNKEEINDE